MTTTSGPWTVAVLGPGGVGGLAAGLLARAGHRVICLAREETAAALGSGGLTVRSGQFGDFEVPVAADTLLRERVDAVLVTPKETGLRSALERMPREALGDALVVPLLNGVEHVDVLRATYPPEQVAAATIRVESTRTAPGVIEHSSPFAMIELAGATAPAERVAALGDVLRAAGFAARVREDETAMLWSKLSFLLPMALLTTRYRGTVGAVRAERRDELLALVEELARVAAAEGAEIDTTALIGQFDAAPSGMRSSMQKDAEAGRPLELDAIGGALLRAADRHGIAVPVAAGLVAALSKE
ncbi:ketopantoate reductase family protein [Streptomyces triticagri]|uniref:2-dehydropantoate 2-reductase n=1 Tax=Streptomyces triticagri TaxID=2293568 RepID=A0A372M4K3_9ACTN|nr:2-dehydropantoate 2-reductase [Streptomyces triticagri]RFU85876.1 ketopantoate reductase family protein [Streptomyces triticagri]